MTEGTQEPNTEEAESETPNSTLEAYRKIVCAHSNPDEAAELANPAAYGLSLICIPTLALIFDWVNLWGAVGLGIGGPIALGIGTSTLKATSTWFKTTRIGVELANVLPMLGLGTSLSVAFDPNWVGL